MDLSKETIKKLYFEQIRNVTMKTCKADRFNFDIKRFTGKI